MKLIPSDSLKAHLLEQNVVMPEGGFDVPDDEYQSSTAALAQSPIHRHESQEAFTDRVDYSVIWKLYGQQQNGNQRGVDLVNAQRMEVMTRSLTKMQDSSLPDIAQKVSAAVEAGSNLVSWSVKEHRDSAEAKGVELVTAVSNLQTFSGANHAEELKVGGERHADLVEIFGKLLYVAKWILGVLIAGFLFLAAIGIAAGILGIHAHAQIDVIKFQDNAGSPVGTVAAPFVIKAGSNCSLAKVGAIVTFNCTGGAAAAGGSNGQVQWNNATALAGITTFTSDGTVNTAQAGLNWFFVDTADTSKKFRFDVSNVTTATTRIVNIPDANSTTVQPDTGAANNYVSAISTQGVITKSRPACATLSDAGAFCNGTAYANLTGVPTLPVTKTAAAGQPLLSYDSATGAFTQAALTAANVGLGSVTNDAQTKAAVVPNTAPGAGQMLIGNAGGTAYVPLGLSQDCTIASTGAITCTKTNNVAFGGGATMSTTAGGDLSGTLPSPTVAKVNGIAYSGTAAAHSVEVITTANTTATAKVIPDCTDVTGNHLNYTQSTDAFSCGTTGGAGGGVTSVATTSPITGGTITTTGTIACATCVTSAAALTNGQLVAGAGLQASAVTNLTGDVTTSGGVATTVVKVNGTTVPTNAAADQVPVTTSSAVAAWKGVPACTDTGGNHLNYDTVAHAFSCGTSGGAGGGVSSISGGTGPISNSGSTGAVTLTYSGTSGGIPYFSSATALSSSAALTLNVLPKGGGAGAAPTNSSITDNGTTVATAEPVVVGTANCTTLGTGGGACMGEGTAPTNVASTTAFYADSTTHELMAATAGSSTFGILNRTAGSVNLTGKTATQTISTACAASAGACNVAGLYELNYTFWGSGTACSSVTAGKVVLVFTWTDENSVAHTAIPAPISFDQKAAAGNVTGTFSFNTALGTEGAYGSLSVSSSGAAAIQYTATYTACTTGTGTYNLRIATTRLQ